MKTPEKQSNAERVAGAKRSKGKTVRGSGFTYTEEQERTDLSVPIEQAMDEKIVKLPDLGKKNRP